MTTSSLLLAVLIVFTDALTAGPYRMPDDDEEGSRMSHRVLSAPTPADEAALIAVLAMEHLLVPPSSELRPAAPMFHLGATGSAVSRDDLVRALAGLGKPIRCRASRRDDEIIVDCDGALSGDARWVLERRSEDFTAGFGLFGAVRLAAAGQQAERSVRVAAESKAVDISLGGLERFLCDYLLDSVGVSGRPPTQDERAEGVAYVITLGLVESLEP